MCCDDDCGLTVIPQSSSLLGCESCHGSGLLNVKQVAEPKNFMFSYVQSIVKAAEVGY